MNTTHIYPQLLFRSCSVSWFTRASRLPGFLTISLMLHGLLFAMIPGLELSTATGQQAMHQPIYLTLNTAVANNRMPPKPLTAQPPSAVTHPTRHDLFTPSRHAKKVQTGTRLLLHSKSKSTSHHTTPTRKLRTTQLAVAAPSPSLRQSIPKPSPNPAAVAALLRRALQQHFHYPVIALQNSWEGKVVLGVSVTADGEVSTAQVLKESGFRILDRAALHAVNDIGRLPTASPLLAGQTLTFRVPVAYRLRH